MESSTLFYAIVRKYKSMISHKIMEAQPNGKDNLLRSKHNICVSSLNFPIYSAIVIAQRLAFLHQASGGEFQRCSPNTFSVMCQSPVGQSRRNSPTHLQIPFPSAS